MDLRGCHGTARSALVAQRMPRVHTTRFSQCWRYLALFLTTDFGVTRQRIRQTKPGKGRRDWRSFGGQSSRVLSRFRDLARSSRARRHRGCPGPIFERSVRPGSIAARRGARRVWIVEKDIPRADRLCGSRADSHSGSVANRRRPRGGGNRKGRADAHAPSAGHIRPTGAKTDA